MPSQSGRRGVESGPVYVSASYRTSNRRTCTHFPNRRRTLLSPNPGPFLKPLPEKRLSIEGVDPLLLFGFNDVFLRKVEDAFPDTQITARGTEIYLRGDDESIDEVEQVFNELTVLLDRNDNLTEDDVDTVLALFTDEDAPASHGEAGDVILFTPDGDVVKPRTPNQNRLVESARKNDVLFAIGPAGTGKTYVAVALAVAALKEHH